MNSFVFVRVGPFVLALALWTCSQSIGKTLALSSALTNMVVGVWCARDVGVRWVYGARDVGVWWVRDVGVWCDGREART